MKAIGISKLASAICAVLICLTAQAQDFDPNNYITGDWNGARSRLESDGVDLHLSYVGEFARNTSGGERHANAYADQIYLGAAFDLDKLVGWQGATFKIDVTDRNGDSVNQRAGYPTLLQSQEIYGRGTVVRLTQFSLTQKLFDDRLSLKAGRLYANADLFSISCKFESLTFCGGLPGYISNGMYTDPISQYGAVAVLSPIQDLQFKLGAYNVNPQNLAKDQGLRLGTSGRTLGTLYLGELDYKPRWDDGVDGDYRLGGWHNTSNYQEVVNRIGLPTSLSDAVASVASSENGYYLNAEQQVFRNAAGGGLRVFFSWTQADRAVDRLNQIIEAGAWLDAPFPSRPNDRIGIAFARTQVSPNLNRAQSLYDALLPATSPLRIGVQRFEYPIELNYNLALTKAISLMPNVQYVRHADGLAGNNGTVAGLQVRLNF